MENIFLGEFEKLRQPTKPAADRPGEPVVQMIRVVDARTDDDVVSIGRILKEAGKLQVLARCAGFAERLPDLLDLPLATVSPKHQRGGTLLVSGSVNHLSIQQSQFAMQKCVYASCLLPSVS